jgi:hypothetical protein
MKTVLLFLLFAVSAVGLLSARSEGLAAESPGSPSLAEIVLFGVRPVKDLNQAARPGDEPACVRRYLGAIPPGSPLWSAPVPSRPEEAVPVRRRNLVEQVVTVMGENTRAEATAFGSAVPLQAEWEGMPEGPLSEAGFVDQWLAEHPGAAIAPFLHPFKAHRLRAAYEAARTCGDKGLRPDLSGRYKESLDKARSSLNLLISCIADDLEAQSHVYLEGRGRP